MIRRIPILATLVVALAVAAMVALGVWQLARHDQKQAALAVYRANLSLPATTFPVANPADERYLFRTVSASCVRVVSWRVIGGRSTDDRPGWRHIASCATGAEGLGLLVDMGVSDRPDVGIAWTGGAVTGRVTHEPDSHSLLAHMMGRAPSLRLMIVSAAGAPGLAPSSPPDPASVPNNHLSYAVQWFLFAAVALIIYGLALRRRWRDAK